MRPLFYLVALGTAALGVVACSRKTEPASTDASAVAVPSPQVDNSAMAGSTPDAAGGMPNPSSGTVTPGAGPTAATTPPGSPPPVNTPPQ